MINLEFFIKTDDVNPQSEGLSICFYGGINRSIFEKKRIGDKEKKRSSEEMPCYPVEKAALEKT